MSFSSVQKQSFTTRAMDQAIPRRGSRHRCHSFADRRHRIERSAISPPPANFIPQSEFSSSNVQAENDRYIPVEPTKPLR